MSPATGSRAARHLRLAGLALASGVLVGLAAFGFLAGLDWATRTRWAHPGLIWLLPVAGLATGAAYHFFGGRAGEGNTLLLEEIHEPSAWVPRRMAPMVAGATVVSHLFGASVGREGSALQMAGSLTDLLNRTFRIGREDRRVLLIAALGGGFGAVFGVPWAGLVFGLEVQVMRRVRTPGLLRWLAGRWRAGRPVAAGAGDAAVAPVPGDDLAGDQRAGGTPDAPPSRLRAAVVPTAIASFVGYMVVRLLGHHEAAHPRFPSGLDGVLLGRAAVIGLACGVTAVVFVEATEAIRRRVNRLVTWPPLRPLVGGVVTVAVAAVIGRDQLGLSIHLVERAFAGDGIGFADPGWKLALTAVCLGTGFVGGEVTPMFVMGATLGAALSGPIGLDPVAGATLGYAAVFAGAANAPVACTVLAVELFGPAVAVPAAVTCVAAFAASGRYGIYLHRPTGERRRPLVRVRSRGSGGRPADPDRCS